MTDPLKNPLFKSPSLGEKLREIFLGASRPLDCVQIEVTSHCYGACTYCPHTTQANAWKSRHMQDEVFASLWPILRQSKRAHLQGWGEPLLHPRFFDYVELANRAGCNVSTTSCGLRIDEKLARQIAGSGMDLIAFSLVGTDAESNAPRKNVDFNSVCESMKTLRKAINSAKKDAPLEIHLAYLLLADRMDAVERLPELMDEIGVDMAVVSTLDYLAIPGQRELAFHPDDEEKIARAREILAGVALRAEKYGRFLHYALPGRQPVADAGGCRENIASSLYIDADGKISPCIYLNVPGDDPEAARRVFGDSREGDPWQIWRSGDFRQFRENLARNNPDPACMNCPKRFERQEFAANG